MYVWMCISVFVNHIFVAYSQVKGLNYMIIINECVCVYLYTQPTSLNKKLNSFMPGLSAKVFRTYNASITLEQQLEKLDSETASASLHELVLI